MAWLALARAVAKRRWTAARQVGPGELRRMVPAWLRRPKEAGSLTPQAVENQRQQERLQWLQQWLRWEAETEARYQACDEQEEQGMSVAAWKQYDNEQLARYERIRQANLAFDAEVGAPSPTPTPGGSG